MLAHGEFGNISGPDGQALSGLRVPSGAGLSSDLLPGPKAHHADFLPPLQRPLDRIKGGVDNGHGLRLGDLGLLGDAGAKLLFVQLTHLPALP